MSGASHNHTDPRLNLKNLSGSFALLSPPSSQPWIVDRAYPSHHNGIVRSLLVDDVLGYLITGGEDGALHLWDLRQSDAVASPSKSGRKRQLHDDRGTEEMDVDHVQVSGQVHNSSSLTNILISPKSRSGGNADHVPLSRYHPSAYERPSMITIRFVQA